MGEGGNIGGGWPITGCSVDNHTLAESEIPSISGSFDAGNTQQGTGEGRYAVSNPTGKFEENMGGGISKTFIESSGSSNGNRITFSFGGGGAHNHGFTSDGTWRPSFAKVITCTKD